MGYENDCGGVTLRKKLENDLKNRLLGVQNVHIYLDQVSQQVLQDEFQCSEELFIDYERTLFNHPSPRY